MRRCLPPPRYPGRTAPRWRRPVLPALAAVCLVLLGRATGVEGEEDRPQPAEDEAADDGQPLACAAPATGFCTACDACCLDFSPAECDACVAAACDAPRRCVARGPDEPCTVCDACCGKPWLASQHACDACVNTTCASSVDVCADHGTRQHPVECSGECWNSCVWAWLPSLSAPCLEQCTASPLFLLVCGVFALRLLEYVHGVFWRAIGCSDVQDAVKAKQGEHAGVLRRCFLRLCRRCCCCCCGDGEYAAVGDGASEAKQRGAGAKALYNTVSRSLSTVDAEAAVAEHLATMGLLLTAASERAGLLVANGHTTVEEFEALSDEQLREQGGFKEGDLRKVAVFRSGRQEPEPEPQPEPEQELQECKNPVGQVVWVKSGRLSDRSEMPWIRGEVEGHDLASGNPLVRAVEGRLKEWQIGGRANSANCDFWSAAESATPRVWEHLRTTPPGFTCSQLNNPGSSWAAARDGNDHSRCGALARGTTKLLLWHALQPALYAYVFSDAFPTLEPVQRWLGGFVLLREALYLLAVGACAWVNPAFLLVDVAASVRDKGARGLNGGYGFLAMYVVAPEKYVGLALLDPGGLNKGSLATTVVAVLGPLVDLCGLGALGAGLGAGGLPPALAVGYTVTALGALFIAWVFVVQMGIKRGDKELLMGGLFGTACILAAFFVPFAIAR
eukprot:COSAG06_NODE_1167_length_10451_cov_16.691654_1_plen_675_part_00